MIHLVVHGKKENLVSVREMQESLLLVERAELHHLFVGFSREDTQHTEQSLLLFPLTGIAS